MPTSRIRIPHKRETQKTNNNLINQIHNGKSQINYFTRKTLFTCSSNKQAIQLKLAIKKINGIKPNHGK